MEHLHSRGNFLISWENFLVYNLCLGKHFPLCIRPPPLLFSTVIQISVSLLTSSQFPQKPEREKDKCDKMSKNWNKSLILGWILTQESYGCYPRLNNHNNNKNKILRLKQNLAETEQSWIWLCWHSLPNSHSKKLY